MEVDSLPDIPVNVFAEILSYFEPASWVTCSLVCRAWHQKVIYRIKTAEELVWRKREQMICLQTILGKYENLRHIFLETLGAEDYLLELICTRFTLLKTLTISDPSCLITATGWTNLKRLRYLKTLKLQLQEIFTDDEVPILLEMKSIETLTLKGCKITDRGVRQLAHIPRLKKVTFCSCPHLTFQEAVLVKLFYGLKRLRFVPDDPTTLTREKLKLFGQFTYLEELHLRPCITLKHFSSLINLTSLRLGLDRSITNNELIHLKPLKKLQRLCLELAQCLTDEGLKVFSDFPELRWFGLMETENFSGAFVKHIQTIEVLDLRYATWFDMEAAARISELPRLKLLRVHGTPFADSVKPLLKWFFPGRAIKIQGIL